MGAINQAFNQAAGTVAAAAAVLKGTKERDMEEALLGKEQVLETDADIKDLQEQLSTKKNEWGEAESDLAILNAKKPGGKGNTKASLDEKRKTKMSEIEAAQRAFDELSSRLEAKKLMRKRAELMIRKANKWGGLK